MKSTDCCTWLDTGWANREGRVWKTSCGKDVAFFNWSRQTVEQLNYCMNCGKPIEVVRQGNEQEQALEPETPVPNFSALMCRCV